MSRTATVFAIRAVLWPAAILVFVACAGALPVAPPVRPFGDSAISLQQNWRAQVLVERDDSIVLTLPSGDRQLQQFHRTAVFTLGVGGEGTVSLRLDSLAVRPPLDGGLSGSPLAAWTGRTDDPRIAALRVSAGGELAGQLTGLVRTLLPRFPIGGVHPEARWMDSATGSVRVDIFTASERRLAIWTAGTVTRGAVGNHLTIRVMEMYEQLGSGQQDGRKVTMTSQGGRRGIYYSTVDGRLTQAELTDSANVLISLPDTRQVVPTMRYSRTSVQFLRPSSDPF